MGDVARPMLAEVLAAVEGLTDPAEAQERLVSRGLLPEGWCGDGRRGWASNYAMPAGSPFDNLPMLGPNPCTIPELVAVASLGWPAIQRAEELARAACAALREYGCPTPERVVWRVAPKFHRYDTVWSRDVRKAETMVLVRDGRFDVPDGFGRIVRHIILPAEVLWLDGLALDAITADAVRIVAPPVGGVR